MDPLTMTIPDARRAMGIGQTKIYELIASGEIEAVKVGARTLIVVASIKQWLDRLPRVGAAPSVREPSNDATAA